MMFLAKVYNFHGRYLLLLYGNFYTPIDSAVIPPGNGGTQILREELNGFPRSLPCTWPPETCGIDD